MDHPEPNAPAGRPTDIPHIDPAIFDAMAHDAQADPASLKDKIALLSNENHALAVYMLIEAFRQSGGNMRLKESFINGTLFAMEALRRQAEATRLHMIFETPDAAAPLEETVIEQQA